MDFLLNNIEWIFSGIGVAIVASLIKVFVKKRNEGRVPNNNLNADNITFNQTILNNSSADKIENNSKVINESNDNSKFKHIKDKYFGERNEIRNYLIEILAEIRNERYPMQIRDITDRAEDEKGIAQSFMASELEKLEEEGLIKIKRDESLVLSPYLEVRLTQKYFEDL